MTTMSILVVEDDVRVADMLRRGLSAEGFAVTLADTGRAATELMTTDRFDLLILDLQLPDADGVDLCRVLREQDNRVAVIMLTARDDIEDRVRGLDAGADDYLTKPFAFAELIARIRARARRSTPAENDNRIRLGPLTIDVDCHEVRCEDRRLDFSAREFELLAALMAASPRVLGRQRLLSRVWGEHAEITENTVDVYIGYLRRKLGEYPAAPVIETVRGVGYRLVATCAMP